jgi:hypothetical protein
MFCWPYFIVYQYGETNVMHFLFNLLRIKGLYMFRALLAHPQEALHKWHLLYCVRVMSVGCIKIESKLQSWCSQLTTNMMHFLFSLLRIKGFYMFRALLAHLQEALYKRHLLYCVRVLSVGCTRIEVRFNPVAWHAHVHNTQYNKCRLFSSSWGWVHNARNI